MTARHGAWREREAKAVSGVRPGVHIVDSKEGGPAYDRLESCAFEIKSASLNLAALDPTRLAPGDVVVVGCSERMLLSPRFRAQVRELARLARVVAVVPAPGPEAAWHAAQAGFHGCVPREASPRAFERSIAAARSGGLVFPRSAVASIIRLIASVSAAPVNDALDGDVLTPRQRQIVELIAEGATDREIAVSLHISESTAHKHVQNALRRANARTRSQLVATMQARNRFPPAFTGRQ